MEASPIEFNLSAADLAILDHGCFYVYVVPSARRQGVYQRTRIGRRLALSSSATAAFWLVKCRTLTTIPGVRDNGLRPAFASRHQYWCSSQGRVGRSRSSRLMG